MKPSPNKFTLNTIIQHYKGIIQSDSFNLATVSESIILTIFKNTKISKAVVVDNKTVQNDTNLVLGGFKDYYSNLAEKLLK